MNYIAAWLKAHSITAKTVIVSIVAAAGVITINPQVQSFVLLTFKNHPAIGTWIIAAAGLVTMLMSPHSDAGALAHAKSIQSQPDAPTAAQVDAATTAK